MSSASRRIDEIIVHCAATKPGMDIGAKEIDGWHRSQGWTKIGYHRVIRRDGTVEFGRDFNEAGAHASGHNAHSIGVCLVGGVDDSNKPEANFTPAQWAALDRLIAGLEELYPNAKVIGHREVARFPKACPSFDVQEWKTKFRPAAAPTRQ